MKQPHPQTLADRARRLLWRHARWIPVAFLIGGTAAVGLLWSADHRAERARLRLEAQITAEQVRLRLEAWVDARTALVGHVAGAHFASREDIDARFATEAGRVTDRYADIQALNFIDPNWVIRIVVPRSSNIAALDQDLHHHPSAGVVEAVARAQDGARLTRTPIIDLLQGGKGIATYLAIRDDAGRLLGFANGVFRVAALVDACLAEAKLREGFRFELIENDTGIAYRHAEGGTAGDWPFMVTETIRVVDRPWTLRLAPSATHLDRSRRLAYELMAGGALVLVIGLAFTLASLVRRHEALQESRAKYQLLVENQGDMVVKVDTAGRFLYVSPSYCEVFGRSEDELLGHEFMPLVHPNDRAATARAMEDLHHPPHRAYVEQRAMTSDGWRWLAWSDTAILDDDGNLAAVIGVGRDITHQRRLEEQLTQSQKLQAIGQLTGGIAHDFNNILQSLLGSYELLKINLVAARPTTDDVRQIGESLDRAVRLTTQLLAFGRQQVLQRETLDLTRVVADMLELLRRVLRESIELVFEPAERALFVRADRVQLEQVVMNLVVNARDAIGNRGTITITTFERTDPTLRVDPDVPRSPTRLVGLAVADTGCGMTAEVLEHLFEPFFTTKPTGAGTGLGLATVYGIVRQHGGTIDATSTADEGSRFVALLPAAPAPDQARQPPVLPVLSEPRRGSETVLFAEDDPTVRQVTVRQLTEGGYRVLEAADGRRAVELFRAHRDEIAIVLLDVVMPNLGGREAAAQIRELRPGIPIVFASGYDPDGTIEGDGETFLAKPYRSQLLLETLRSLLDTASAPRPGDDRAPPPGSDAD